MHNPEYAGAYVYGRTKTRLQCLPGEEPRVKGRTRQVRPEDWPFLIPGHHPGYITWDQFQRNQRRLDDNRTSPDEDRRGVPREGFALLQGIVRCGRCGRRMSVRYLKNGSIPSYECNSVHTHYAGKTCQSMRGDEIDAAVAQALLEAMRPAQLEVSMAAFDQVAAQARQLDRQWQLTLERARYEAELARRRFVAVEPENRLVVRTLEREWNERLAEIERMERDATLRPQLASRLVDPAEATSGPGTGSGPFQGLACPDDAPNRSQAIAGIFNQRCNALSGRHDNPSGHPLADRGLHSARSSSPQALLRGAPD